MAGQVPSSELAGTPPTGFARLGRGERGQAFDLVGTW